MDTVPSELLSTLDFKDTSMQSGWAADHPRATQKSPTLAAAAITLLRTPTALAQLSPEEAACVVSFMRLVGFASGAMVIKEGDQLETGYMLLLSGEVSVQTLDAGTREPVVISVLGPGNLVGEMGLLDGAPRSATCVATSRIEAAVLSRGALDQLIEQHPQVGAKLMVALSQRLGDRLRATGQQIGMYVQLMHNMQLEIDGLKRQLQDLGKAVGGEA